MFSDNVKLLEMPEYNSISVCVYNENEGLLEFGERLNEKFEEAYMNGYNWDAVISCYVKSVDPELAEVVNSDPEAGMYSAYMEYSEENLEKMKRFEMHVKKMLSDEETLTKFIEENYDSIEWD